MNLLDILIIGLTIFAVYRWMRLGLVRGLFLLVGLIGGFWGGIMISPWIVSFFTARLVRFVVMLATVGTIMTLLALTTEFIGFKLTHKLQKPVLQKANAIAGGILSLIVMLVIIWIGAGILANSPFISLNQQIQHSFIITNLNKNFPPSPPVVTRISSLFKDLEFPQVFVGAPPKLAPPVAPASSEIVQAAVAVAGKSAVRVESLGCGGILAGSGFVVANQLIMTNAHVVAGTDITEVVTVNGRFNAETVYFDPNLDIAILKTRDLAIQPLKISDKIYQRGQQVVVLGFPNGGEFKAEPAGVMRLLDAVGLDIYDYQQVERNIYELQVHVVQGNSGGPLVLADGTVIGMIFAAAPNDEGYGYALTGPDLTKALSNIRANKISTQTCLSK